MFKKILVPVDGSDCSGRAVKVAASLAEKYQSEVYLLHIIELPSTNLGFGVELGAIPQQLLDDLETDGKELLARHKNIFNNTPVKTDVRFGHPAKEILDEAKNEFDLIVMGSRGLGEIRGFVAGSVSDRITHHATCSVMVIH